jgi:serine/threonine protein kinase/tetratricopeptide (TPR) repeat protein
MGRTQRLAQPEEFGKYHLIARLAHGRMGDVYKAKSHGVEGFERILALKTIDPGLAAIPGFVDAVVEEGQRAVQLSHANVVQILDLGQEEQGGRVYIAMEFVAGLDLNRALTVARQSRTPWSMELSVFIGAEIANGLDYAHRRKDYNFNRLNIVHRDLSPFNVLLSSEGAVKLTDFGISKAMDLVPPMDNEERIRRLLYASPEAARGEAHTQQSDVYSLGLILYEMLTGVHPYMSPDPEEVYATACAGRVPPISQHGNIPRALSQIIESMLVPDPAGRASSAGQVYEELVGFLFGNNIQADANVLSVFIQELRRADTELYPGRMADEVGMEEVSLSDFKVPEAAKSSFEDDSEVEDSTRDALPRQKIQQLVMGQRAADSAQAALPGALEQYFTETRAGRGKAVLVYGQLGAGRDYLPDRLVDALKLRGNTLASSVQLVRDDRHRPFGALGDALKLTVGMNQPEEVGRGESLDEMALRRCAELGVGEQALEVLAGVWGRAPGPQIGYAHKRRELVRASALLIQDMCQRHTLVMILDRVEFIDRLSLDVLRDLIAEIGKRPAMVLMSTNNVEHMRQELDTGNPEHLGAVKVLGTVAPRMSAVRGMSEDSTRALALMAVSQHPMTQGELAKMLGVPGDRIIRAVRELAELGVVRVPSTGVFMVALPDVGVWLEGVLGREETRRLAEVLLRERERQHGMEAAGPMGGTITRWNAMAGRRRRTRNAAVAYLDWLRREGMNRLALGAYKELGEILGAHLLGAPLAQSSFMLSRAELALEMADVEECRAALAPLSALSEQLRDERGHTRHLLLLGQMTMQQDDLEEAREHFDRALESARALKNPDLVARALVAQASWYERYGDNTNAQRVVDGAMNLYRRWGTSRMDLRSRAVLLTRAINLMCARGMAGRAWAMLDDLRRIAEVTRMPSVQARVAWAQARLLIERGEHYPAREQLMWAEQSTTQHGLTALCIEVVRQHAQFALDGSDWEGALGILNGLAQTAQRHEDIYSVQRAQDMSAFARAMLGHDVEGSLERLRASAQLAMTRHIPKDIHRVNGFLARALEAAGRADEAARHREIADKIGRAMRLTQAA